MHLIAFLEILVTFAALLALAGFFAGRTRLPAGAAPLLALCLSVLWYSALACLDLLFLGGVLWFLAAFLALVWCVKNRRAFTRQRLLTPSVVFFVAASLAVLVLFSVRQPIFMEWDEFSFWGIAPKVVKETGRLYLLEPGELRSITFGPSLVMLDYIFQFLGAAFVPWKVYAAYDILLFAIFAAGLGCLERKNWHLAVLGGSVMVLLPYLLTVYMRNIYVETTYMTCYADVPMGLLFGAPLALYFAAEEKTEAVLATACAAIAVACLSKETSFALALVAAAIICFDVLFVRKKDEVRLTKRLSGLPAKLCWCGLAAGSAVAPYVAWVLYRTPFLGGGVSATDLGGDQEMGMFQMLFTGVKELLGIGRTERFSRVMGKMGQYFYSTSLSEFRVGALDAGSGVGKYINGSGLVVVCIILGLLALAFFAAGKGRRAGVAWFSLWSTLGFAAYYIFIGFTYVYVFPEADEMTNYNRYIYPYYLGWMLAAVAILALCLRPRAQAGRTAGGWKKLGALGLAAVALFSCWRTVSFVRPQLSVVDYPDSYFAGRRRAIGFAQQAKTVLDEGQRVFFVCMGADNGDWFKTYYDLYPEVHLDYSFGGGSIVTAQPPAREYDARTGGMEYDEAWGFYFMRPGTYGIPKDVSEEDSAYFRSRPFTPEVLCRYLEVTGCTALYVEKTDAVFEAVYGSLFDDGLQSGARLYRVEGTGDGMHFSPVPEGGLRT